MSPPEKAGAYHRELVMCRIYQTQVTGPPSTQRGALFFLEKSQLILSQRLKYVYVDTEATYYCCSFRDK